MHSERQLPALTLRKAFFVFQSIHQHFDFYTEICIVKETDTELPICRILCLHLHDVKRNSDCYIKIDPEPLSC